MHPIPLRPPRKSRKSFRKPLIFGLVVVTLAGFYLVAVMIRPFATLQPTVSDSNVVITTQSSTLPWPAYGQGAYGSANGGVIATHGDQAPVPIASAAKIITALLVLQQHPLKNTESGPTITLTTNDVALYSHYIAVNGSVMPVSVGQKLTERQMLEALMLPSANNIADSLAIWSYGSVNNYITAANAYLKEKGLSDTTVAGDASGYLPSTVSTTGDLVKIGGLAMQNTALAQIVNEKTATIPGVGIVRNYNTILGSNGIVGIKTGNNDQNNGVFVGATTVSVNDKTVTLISALSGAPNLATVLRDSQTLLAAARTTFAQTSIVRAGTVLGTYKLPDGTLVQAVAANNLSMMVLRGDIVKAHISLRPITYSAKDGDAVGNATVTASEFAPSQSVTIILKQAPHPPSLQYRLRHPFST